MSRASTWLPLGNDCKESLRLPQKKNFDLAQTQINYKKEEHEGTVGWKLAKVIVNCLGDGGKGMERLSYWITLHK